MMTSDVGYTCDMQKCVDKTYNRIDNALSLSADQFVLRVRGNFYKPWWNDMLSELKEASITAHELWESLGRPSSGQIFMQMKRAKLAYKSAI